MHINLTKINISFQPLVWPTNTNIFNFIYNVWAYNEAR